MTTTRNIQATEPAHLGQSVVDWLGEIPAHWTMRKLKFIADIKTSNVNKKSADDEEAVRLCNYVDVYYHEYITSSIDFMAATATPEEIRRFSLERGDVLITKDSEEWNDIAVPAVVDEELEGVLCGYHLAQIRPFSDLMDGEYLCRAFAAHAIRDQFRVRANGITRLGLSRDAITSALFPVPPLEEQLAIAAFLRRATGKIDDLLVKKRRIIELLQEKRIALICHAVTKGLNPATPLRSSGIDWLGDIPAHWTTPPLYARYLVKLGKMLDEKRITGEYLLPYIRNVDVRWDRVNVEDLPEMDFTPEERERFSLREGDLVVCEGGEAGRTAIWHGELTNCSFQKAIHRLRPTSPDDRPRFLYYVMYAASKRGVFLADGNPNTIPHLTAEKLRVYRFPFPPTDEQQAIVEHLDRVTTHTDALIVSVEKAIDRLVEYRNAIITAAVTGRIDPAQAKVRVSLTRVAAPPPKRNEYFLRTVLAAEVVEQFHVLERFGQIKLQKCIFLLLYVLKVYQEKSNFRRAKYGPFDNKMVRSIESQMRKLGWYDAKKVDGRTVYEPMTKAGGHKEYFNRYFGDRVAEFQRVLDLVRPMKTEQSEIVATLFGAWNDLLIAGQPFDDAEIIRQARECWHEHKKEIEEWRWANALKWMRHHRLEPEGFGPTTRETPQTPEQPASPEAPEIERY